MRIPRTTLSISVPFLLLTALASVELLWNANSANGTGLMLQVNELCSPSLSANSTLGQEAEYGASSEQASTEVVCKLTTIFVPMIEVSGIPSFALEPPPSFPVPFLCASGLTKTLRLFLAVLRLPRRSSGSHFLVRLVFLFSVHLLRTDLFLLSLLRRRSLLHARIYFCAYIPIVLTVFSLSLLHLSALFIAPLAGLFYSVLTAGVVVTFLCALAADDKPPRRDGPGRKLTRVDVEGLMGGIWVGFVVLQVASLWWDNVSMLVVATYVPSPLVCASYTMTDGGRSWSQALLRLDLRYPTGLVHDLEVRWTTLGRIAQDGLATSVGQHDRPPTRRSPASDRKFQPSFCRSLRKFIG